MLGDITSSATSPEKSSEDDIYPGWTASIENAKTMAGGSAAEYARHFGRSFSLGDLLKLCGRLEIFRGKLNTDQLKGDMTDILRLSLPYRERAFSESADCFLGMIADENIQTKLQQSLAYLWGLDIETVDRMSKSGVELENSSLRVKVGRATLAKKNEDTIIKKQIQVSILSSSWALGQYFVILLGACSKYSSCNQTQNELTMSSTMNEQKSMMGTIFPARVMRLSYVWMAWDYSHFKGDWQYIHLPDQPVSFCYSIMEELSDDLLHCVSVTDSSNLGIILFK